MGVEPEVDAVGVGKAVRGGRLRVLRHAPRYPQRVAWGMDLADLRTQYRNGTLDLVDLDPDPLRQFRAWLDDAVAADLREPNATSLATADADGAPSVPTMCRWWSNPGRSCSRARPC